MPWTKKIEEEWIVKNLKDDAVEWSKSFAQYLTSDQDGTRPLTTSQLRRFFGHLKQIQADWDKLRNEIPMLKPQLAYAVGRDMKSGRNQTKIREFYDAILDGLKAVDPEDKNTYNRFVSLVESIVAYHKFHGGQ
jgi:CRISPR-associated protein Csm2